VETTKKEANITADKKRSASIKY